MRCLGVSTGPMRRQARLARAFPPLFLADRGSTDPDARHGGGLVHQEMSLIKRRSTGAAS